MIFQLRLRVGKFTLTFLEVSKSGIQLFMGGREACVKRGLFALLYGAWEGRTAHIVTHFMGFWSRDR